MAGVVKRPVNDEIYHDAPPPPAFLFLSLPPTERINNANSYLLGNHSRPDLVNEALSAKLFRRWKEPGVPDTGIVAFVDPLKHLHRTRHRDPAEVAATRAAEGG